MNSTPVSVFNIQSEKYECAFLKEERDGYPARCAFHKTPFDVTACKCVLQPKKSSSPCVEDCELYCTEAMLQM